MEIYKITLFFAFMWAGVANAIMDVLKQNYLRSIFVNIENVRWRVWWRSWAVDKPKSGLRSKWFMAWTWDGWHHMKSQMLVMSFIFLPVSAWFYNDIVVLSIDIVTGYLIWTAIHELFLHKLLLGDV